MNPSIALLKKLLVTLLQGAAFGLGLAGVIAIFIDNMQAPQASTESMVTEKTIPSPSKTAISEEFLISDINVITSPPVNANITGLPYRMDITGSIENKGIDILDHVNIYADLYDKSGKFIYQCDAQIPNIKHHEKLNFLIDCYSLPAEILTQYASNKIYAKAYGR